MQEKKPQKGKSSKGLIYFIYTILSEVLRTVLLSFTVLKASGLVEYSWWLILSPLGIELALVVIMFIYRKKKNLDEDEGG